MAGRLYTREAVHDLVLLEEISQDAILKTLQTRHKKVFTGAAFEARRAFLSLFGRGRISSIHTSAQSSFL